MDFFKREQKKLEEKNSKEKAFAFSFEKIEEELNSWIQRDKYSNKIINNIIDNLSKNNNLKVDSFLQIVNYTLNSLEKIVDNPKKNLIKISEFQEINKITTTDFKTMVWLGSKPGKNLAEKIGVKGKVLAPKNIYSIDKKENRITTYYVKKVLEILEMRFLSYKKNNIDSKEFQEIYKRFYRIKRKMILNEMFSLKRPLDFIPNNTLIDHRDYSTVNRGLNSLKKYIKDSNYTEEELKEQSTFIIFINILNNLNNLSYFKVVKKIFNIEKIVKSIEDKKPVENKIEYFIENQKKYYLEVEIKDKKLKISLSSLSFNKETKRIEKATKLLAEEIEVVISKKYDLEKNLLKFSILNTSDEEMILDDKNLELKGKEIVEKILRIVGKEEYFTDSNLLLLNEEENGAYLNLSTPISYINDKILENTGYSTNLDSFVGIKDYFSISESEEITSLSDNFCEGKNLEKISKYLEKLSLDSMIGIYSSPEYQDSEVQKDIYTIFNSKTKESYPIWRSILAAYTLDNEIKENKDMIILDLNIKNPSLNIVRKWKNTFEHHPILIKDSEDLKEFSLDNFIESYLKKYLNEYKIKLSDKEKKNLLSSGKVTSILFSNIEKIIVNKDKNFFYLEKDFTIFNNLNFELSKKFFKLLEIKSKDLGLVNKKTIIIADYISSIPKNLNNNFDIEILKEKKLGECKDKILDKILDKKPVWKEFLPNLTLETIKEGHFYNLNLIKDKSINLTLGEEVIFDVEDTLIFPVGQEIIKFPLYSEDSLNKKIYFLEVKSPALPLRNLLEVKFKIGYSYGNRNPYRIIVSSNNDQIDFETKWIENKEEVAIKQINFPEIVVNENEGENILTTILRFKNDYQRLQEHLKRSKNKFRKYLIYKVEKGYKEEIINHPAIIYLISLLNSENLETDFQYAIKLFLSSFNNLISLDILNSGFQIEKRKFLFNYQYGNMKLKTLLGENGNVLNIVETISELSWLDKDFIKGVVEREPQSLDSCLTQVMKTLKHTRENFDQQYKFWWQEKKPWMLTNKIRNCFEFLLALFLLNKENNILSAKMKDKKEYYELLYNIKEIDRKIQMETIKYPGLKEEYNKGIRIRITIDNKEGLEEVSDLVYSLFNYMTGSNGSDLIKVKEILED